MKIFAKSDARADAHCITVRVGFLAAPTATASELSVLCVRALQSSRVAPMALESSRRQLMHADRTALIASMTMFPMSYDIDSVAYRARSLDWPRVRLRRRVQLAKHAKKWPEARQLERRTLAQIDASGRKRTRASRATARSHPLAPVSVALRWVALGWRQRASWADGARVRFRARGRHSSATSPINQAPNKNPTGATWTLDSTSGAANQQVRALRRLDTHLNRKRATQTPTRGRCLFVHLSAGRPLIATHE